MLVQEEEEEKEDFVTKPFYCRETFRNDEEHINFTVLKQPHPKTIVKFVESGVNLQGRRK